MSELGKGRDPDISQDQAEYNHLVTFETELFKTRWTVFTTLLSISFIISGLALRQIATDGISLFLKLLCSLGVLVYFVGFYQYLWFHHKAHALRKRLIEIEKRLGYQMYTIREESRPSLFGIKLRFHWIIDTLTALYALLLLFVWSWG